ncbi:MAG TPA: uroporphyrinogen-III synthase [Terriglobales bacterium]|nr:uroporphyrinogen-III synthase [Terriglobales bacterium]
MKKKETHTVSSAAPSGPLAGKRIVVSRARDQAEALSFPLRELGAEVLEIPLIEIRPPASFQALDDALLQIHDYDWLILTSVNGVKALAGRIQHLGLDALNFVHLKVAAIGPATEQALEAEQFQVDVVPDKYVAEAVVSSLRGQVKGQRILLVRAKIARDVIPEELRRAGAVVTVVEAYETVPPEVSRGRLQAALRDSGKKPDVITFTSSSTVRNFVSLLLDLKADGESAAAPLLEGVKLASIGPVTSATLRHLGLPVDIEAREYTVPGLVRAIVAAFS